MCCVVRKIKSGSGAGNAVLAQQLLAQLANDWDADDDEEPEPLAAAVAGAGGL